MALPSNSDWGPQPGCPSYPPRKARLGWAPALDSTRKGKCVQELSRAVWGRRRFLWEWEPRERGQHPQDSGVLPPPRALTLPQREVPRTSLGSHLGLGELGLVRFQQPLGKVSRKFPDRRPSPTRLCRQHFGQVWGTDSREKREGSGPGRGPRLCPISHFLR